jgi:hypothetical protein
LGGATAAAKVFNDVVAITDFGMLYPTGISFHCVCANAMALIANKERRAQRPVGRRRGDMELSSNGAIQPFNHSI